MQEVTGIPFYITISKDAPYTRDNKQHVGEVSSADLGVTLKAVDDDHVEYRSPFGDTTVRYAKKGLLGIHIVHDSRGAHHWPSFEAGAANPHGGSCWDCTSLGCANSGCGGQGICNGKTCPSS